MHPGGAEGVVHPAVFQRLQHRLEAVRRRCHLDRPGAVQHGLAGGEAAGADLVLQPANGEAIRRAVRQHRRHQIAAQAAGALGRSARPGGGQRQPGPGIAGEPFQPGQAPGRAVRLRHRGGGGDVGAAMQFGGPGAAGQRLAVHPGQQRQPSAAHRIRRQPVERPGDGAGQGHRAVQRHIGLGQHAAHDEGQQMRRPLRHEGEADDAAAIGVGVAGAVFGVQHHPADRRAGAVMAFEPGRGVPAGVVGLRLHRLADPGAELGQPVAEARQQVGAAPGQAALQVAVGGEQVQAADGRRQLDRSGLGPVHGGLPERTSAQNSTRRRKRRLVRTIPRRISGRWPRPCASPNRADRRR